MRERENTNTNTNINSNVKHTGNTQMYFMDKTIVDIVN